MADLGKLVVNLEANVASFQRDMEKASKNVETAMGRMAGAANMVKGAIGLIGVGFAADALMTSINRSMDALANLDDMAQRTGASVEDLSKLGKVATMTATDFGAVDGALVKLSKSMADADGNGGKVRRALDAIGISADGIEKKDPAKVFVEISRKLQNYEDGAVKVALVNDLMGKSAADLIPYMNDVADSFDDFTGDSANAAAAAAKFQDDIGKLKVGVDEWVTSMLTGAVPAANDFIAAIKEVSRQTGDLTDSAGMTTWADEAALVFARMADGGALVARTFKAVGAQIVATTANFELMNSIQENVNPFGMAKVLAAGGSPNDNIKAALAKRNAIVVEANTTIAELWTKPLDAMEQTMRSRIAGRTNLDTASIDALAGLAAPGANGKSAINYTPTAPKAPKRDRGGADEEYAERLRIASSLDDETIARQALADGMRASQNVLRDFGAARLSEIEVAARAIQQNEANVEQIRFSLMDDVAREAEAHQMRLAELRTFHDAKFANVAEANALMEAETSRHEQAKADMRRQTDQMVIGAYANSAGQLYGLMKQAGLQQTAIGKAAFLATKALAVAQIIISTNVAAAAALAPPPIGLGPLAGMGLAGTIKALGYASAGMTAGLAIAEASAEGGYDIPAGTNPVTQLHEKEMVLPKAQADVIRGLATRGGAPGGATVHYSPSIHVDSRSDQAQVHQIVSNAVRQGNAELVDRLTRAGRL